MHLQANYDLSLRFSLIFSILLIGVMVLVYGDWTPVLQPGAEVPALRSSVDVLALPICTP